MPNNSSSKPSAARKARHLSIPQSSECTCGRAPVSIGQLWGFVDTKGKIVVPIKYKSVSYFEGGFACVYDDHGRLFIDIKGRRVAAASPALHQQHWTWAGAPPRQSGYISDKEYGKISALTPPKGYAGYRSHGSGRRATRMIRRRR
jgi:hypothetical protein